MLSYKLDREAINAEKLLGDIQKLINSRRNKNVECLLHICIKEISYEDNSLIPKLEYKPDCPT
jgi:hypothetical protein